MIPLLEIRAMRSGSSLLTAVFPYNNLAVIHDGGRGGGKPRKEQFRAGAFAHSINSADQEINLLVGHSFDRPLASKNAGSLTFSDSPDALTLHAEIGPAIKETTYWRDFAAGYAAGLITGISPGFRLPPPSAVATPEVFADEPPRLGRAIIRTLLEVILFEFSLVTRPAYQKTSVSIRDYDHDEFSDESDVVPIERVRRIADRWR